MSPYISCMSIKMLRLAFSSKCSIARSLTTKPTFKQAFNPPLCSMKCPASLKLNGLPPDTDIAVGPNYIIYVVNDDIRWCDKLGNVLAQQDINSWLGDSGFIFDPKVIYDAWSQRWVILFLEKDNNAQTSRIRALFSQTSDPLGSYWSYNFNVALTSGAETLWLDYAALGYSFEALYASGNMFSFTGSAFEGVIRTWNKAEVYTGAGASTVVNRALTNTDGSDAASIRSGHNPSRIVSGAEAWFVNTKGSAGNSVTLWQMTDPIGAHTLAKFNVPVARLFGSAGRSATQRRVARYHQLSLL